MYPPGKASPASYPLRPLAVKLVEDHVEDGTQPILVLGIAEMSFSSPAHLVSAHSFFGLVISLQ